MRALGLLVGGAMLLAAAPSTPDKPKRERLRDDREVVTDPANKMICKRSVVLGSLVATQKECRTRREWAAIRMDARTAGLGSACPTNARC
jgi:hypothetical protein